MSYIYAGLVPGKEGVNVGSVHGGCSFCWWK